MNPVTLIQLYDDRKKLGRRGFRLPLLDFAGASRCKVIDYILDGRNNRVGKKVDGVLAQTFIYSNEGQIIFEVDNATQVSKAFAYAAQNHVPDQMTINGTHYLIVTDAIGSVRMVLDRITGAIMQELDYDAFGNVVKDTNPGFCSESQR